MPSTMRPHCPARPASRKSRPVTAREKAVTWIEARIPAAYLYRTTGTVT
jgi:hypothetical protein